MMNYPPFTKPLTLAAAVLGLLPGMAGQTHAADRPDEITVAYFLEWPTANQVAQAKKWYDEEMGVTVNWRAFGNGNEMSAAMASGDVQIAYSQGLVPWVIAVSKGLPLHLVGIAVSYAENDNCVVHENTGITKANAQELEGKRVASPIGNVTHYKMLRVLEHLNVNADEVDILPMNGAEGAAALSRGDVAMACAFGGPLAEMKKHGEVLMTAKEQQEIGIRVFDVISVREQFAEEHPEMVTEFLAVTERANRYYKNNSERAYPIITNQAGMEQQTAKKMLSKFSFPSIDAQVSDAWLGGTVQDFTKQVANFFVEQGEMGQALDDYSPYIDASHLKQAKKSMD